MTDQQFHIPNLKRAPLDTRLARREASERMCTIAIGTILSVACLSPVVATTAQQTSKVPSGVAPLEQQLICANAAREFMNDWPRGSDRVEHESRFSQSRGVCLVIVKVWFTRDGIETFNSNVFDALGRQRIAVLTSTGDNKSVIWFDGAGRFIEQRPQPDDIAKFNLLVAGK